MCLSTICTVFAKARKHNLRTFIQKHLFLLCVFDSATCLAFADRKVMGECFPLVSVKKSELKEMVIHTYLLKVAIYFQ